MTGEAVAARECAAFPRAVRVMAVLLMLGLALGAVATAVQMRGATWTVQGVAMVQTQVVDVFRRHGITRIEAQGQPFDPNKHQAVMQQPSKEQPPGTVLQVLEHGYMIHDRVLRPANSRASSQDS